MRRLLLRASPLGVLVAGLLLLVAAPAVAHGDLAGGSPGPGDDVATGSSMLQLEFEELAGDGQVLVAVLDGAGDPVPVGDAAITDGRTVCARVSPLGAGVHTVDYRVPAVDGHPLSGRYQFEVSEGGEAVDTPACSAADLAEPGEAQSLSEMGSAAVPTWLIGGLAALAVLTGGLVVVRIRRDRRSDAAH